MVEVVRDLNGEVICLMGKRIVDIIKEVVGLKEKRFDFLVNVWYFFIVREFEGG